ncbi:MAG: helix-hairpin-helix domain-containing protein [Melioribacteraceae bacterium]|nr:helix-hairpin-helix domain-containing protein [Melioribacteraceae bacterium]
MLNKIIDQLSSKLNLTNTELKIFLFLLFTLIGGIIINVWKSSQKEDLLEVDYSKQDSMFYSSIGNIEDEEGLSIENTNQASNNLIKVERKKVENSNVNKNISTVVKINYATEDELSKLPGIGIKTAKNLVEYRNKNGAFKNADELLNVKGIGKSKLEKIRMLLNFDK